MSPRELLRWLSPAESASRSEFTRRSAISAEWASRAWAYLGMGERGALDGLEKAYRAHSQLMNMLKMDRIYDPLRSEPRFIALMKKVNFEK